MVRSALYDPIVVEPALTEEKIRELLRRGAESAKLDYKSSLNPSDKQHKVRLAKHAMAMSNTAGGYIVVGANDDGSVRGVTQKQAQRLDEATIRAQIAGYCDVPLAVFVDNGQVFEGDRLVIITLLPLSDRIAIAARDGAHSAGTDFRAGDVLVRHGSASERWNQADADFIQERISKAHKDDWLREFSSDYRRLGELSGGSATLEIDESMLELPSDEFQKAVIQLMRTPSG